MPRQQSLLVAVVLLILGGAAVFLFSSDDAPPPESGPANRTEQDTDGSSRRATVTEAAAGTGERTAVAGGASTDRNASNRPLHPSVRAALAGFEGRVVTSDGTPVADSLVRLYRFALDQAIRPGTGLFVEDGERAFPDAFAAEQRTGEDGRFRLDGVFPRAFFLLRADLDGDAPTNKIVQRTPGPAEMIDLGDIVLQDCGVLVGRVLNDRGEPMPDTLVRAIDLPGTLITTFYPVQRFDPAGGIIADVAGTRRVVAMPAWVEQRFDELPIPTTRTDSDGFFRLGGVVPGSNMFTVYTPGWLDHTRDAVTVEAGAELDLGEIRLREGEVAGGRVVDDAGEPIEGAEVLVAEGSPNSNVPVHLAHQAPDSGADGSFELGGFPSGEVWGAARRRRSDPWTIVGPVDVLDDLEIALPSEHTLTVRVVDPEDEPIDGAKIQLNIGDAQEGAFEMAMFGMTEPVVLKERLRQLEDGSYRVDGLATGDYAVLVKAPGRAIAANDITLDEDVTITVVLEGEQTFEAFCVDQNGVPVGGAEVYAVARGGRPRLPNAPVWAGTSDDDGLVEIDGIRATEAAVTAQHPAYGTAHAITEMPRQGPVTLTFLTPGSIAGNLLEGGAEPEPGKWMVLCSRSWSDGPDQRGALPDMPRVVTPTLDGNFLVTGLKPGDYRLQVVRSMDMLTSPGRSMQFATTMMMMGETDQQSVQVTSGATAQITLDAMAGKLVTGPSAVVTGTLLVDGQGGVGYLVSARSGGKRFSAETDATGRFDLGLLPAGDVRVQIMPKPSGDFLSFRRMGDEMWEERFKLEEGVDKDLLIELQLTTVSGMVLSSNGAPASGVRVRARGEVARADGEGGTNSVSFNEETDSRGRFEFPEVPVGTYSLTVSDDELGRASVTGIEALAGIGATNLQVMLDPVFKIRGRLDMAVFGTDKPRWFGLQFNRTDGDGSNSSSWSQVDREDGSFEASGLSPGTYEVRCFGANSGNLRGAAPIQLGNGDLDGVVIQLIKEQPQGQGDRK